MVASVKRLGGSDDTHTAPLTTAERHVVSTAAAAKPPTAYRSEQHKAPVAYIRSIWPLSDVQLSSAPVANWKRSANQQPAWKFEVVQGTRLRSAPVAICAPTNPVTGPDTKPSTDTATDATYAFVWLSVYNAAIPASRRAVPFDAVNGIQCAVSEHEPGSDREALSYYKGHENDDCI